MHDIKKKIGQASCVATYGIHFWKGSNTITIYLLLSMLLNRSKEAREGNKKSYILHMVDMWSRTLVTWKIGMWRSEVSTDALSNLNNGVKSDPDREETPAV